MNEKKALVLILILFMFDAASDAYFGVRKVPVPLWWDAVSIISLIMLILTWYHFDSSTRGYARSKWLNAGVIFAAVIAIPYYLIRSREDGKKIKALVRLLGFAMLSLISMVIGAFAGALIA
jgi:hypothetical protein